MAKSGWWWVTVSVAPAPQGLWAKFQHDGKEEHSAVVAFLHQQDLETGPDPTDAYRVIAGVMLEGEVVPVDDSEICWKFVEVIEPSWETTGAPPHTDTPESSRRLS